MSLVSNLRKATEQTLSRFKEMEAKHHLEKTKADKLAEKKEAEAIISSLPAQLKKHTEHSDQFHFDVMTLHEKWDHFKRNENNFSRLRGTGRMVFLRCKKLGLNPKVTPVESFDGMGNDVTHWVVRVSW